MERLGTGAMAIVLGQKKVLQRVPFGDWAGLGHAAIFWGFLTFMLSYAIFIFRGGGVEAIPRVVADRNRRNGVQQLPRHPSRRSAGSAHLGCRTPVGGQAREGLSFDLTRNPDAIIIVGMIAGSHGLHPADPQLLRCRGWHWARGGRHHRRRSRVDCSLTGASASRQPVFCRDSSGGYTSP